MRTRVRPDAAVRKELNLHHPEYRGFDRCMVWGRVRARAGPGDRTGRVSWTAWDPGYRAPRRWLREKPLGWMKHFLGILCSGIGVLPPFTPCRKRLAARQPQAKTWAGALACFGPEVLLLQTPQRGPQALFVPTQKPRPTVFYRYNAIRSVLLGTKPRGT